jgi:hypothetical protein
MVEPLLIEACGQDMLHEQFQFMGKITDHYLVYSLWHFPFPSWEGGVAPFLEGAQTWKFEPVEIHHKR